MDKLEWKKPRGGRHFAHTCDVNITKIKSGDGFRYRLSFRDTGWRHFNGGKDFALVYAVDKNLLYFKKSDDGYSMLLCTGGGTALFFTVRDELLEPFIGRHFLQYDDELKLWYVSQNDRM